MSTSYYLVCNTTRQCVHVCERGSFSVRGPNSSSVVGLFCLTHGDEVVVLAPDEALMLDFGPDERRKIDTHWSELTEWTIENASEKYHLLTGRPPPKEWAD